MRLNEDKIKYLSSLIVKTMKESENITFLVDHKTVAQKIAKIITVDLEMEDQIEDEVRDILKGYTQTINQEGLDYESLFQKAKERLIRRRGLIF